jgi:hypothetical protein
MHVDTPNWEVEVYSMGRHKGVQEPCRVVYELGYRVLSCNG